MGFFFFLQVILGLLYYYIENRVCLAVFVTNLFVVETTLYRLSFYVCLTLNKTIRSFSKSRYLKFVCLLDCGLLSCFVYGLQFWFPSSLVLFRYGEVFAFMVSSTKFSVQPRDYPVNLLEDLPVAKCAGCLYSLENPVDKCARFTWFKISK